MSVYRAVFGCWPQGTGAHHVKCAGWQQPLGIQASETSLLASLLPASSNPEANCWVVEAEGFAHDSTPRAFVCTSCTVAKGTQLALGRPPAASPAPVPAETAGPAAADQVR